MRLCLAVWVEMVVAEIAVGLDVEIVVEIVGAVVAAVE